MPARHGTFSRRARLAGTIICCAWRLAAFGSEAAGAGGSANLLLVVNQDSYASLTVANHYAQLRNVPDANIVHLSQVPAGESAEIGELRQRVLQPVLAAIRERQLAPQIDCIAYSDGFPTRIKLWSDTLRHKERSFPFHFKAVGSLNALTYFADQVLAEQADYIDLASNRYMRSSRLGQRQNPFSGPLAGDFQRAVEAADQGRWAEARTLLATLAAAQPDQALVHFQLARAQAREGLTDAAAASLATSLRCGWNDAEALRGEAALAEALARPALAEPLARLDAAPDASLATTGFRRTYCWGANGLRNSTADQGARYYLSTVLAVGRERGPSLAESVAALRRSVAADGSRPEGAFYFALTADIRSKTRSPQFPELQRALGALGYAAQMTTQWAPQGKADIAGLSFGVANYDWNKTNSSFLPGAIGECLTSGGGVIGPGPQTPCTDMLRYGAAGSSGAVIEPFAIPQKFPHLMIHAHYARGATLAEAYYQSVHAPYQLLIVGDPLCRPWGRRGPLTIEGLQDGEVVDGPRVLQPRRPADDGPGVREFRVYVDGRLRETVPAAQPLRLSAEGLAPGSHELRISAVDDHLIEGEQSGAWQFSVGTAAEAPRIEALAGSAPHRVRVRAIPRVALRGEADYFPLRVFQHQREIGALRSANDVLEIDAAAVGSGPVRLRACARRGGRDVWSPPLVAELGDLPAA
jgi:uncharacterized protein (TIGR03790 family)